MMRMFFERGRVGAIRGCWSMTIQADPVCRLAELRIVLGAMYIVARCAGDPAPVHHTLGKVISLHTILMSRAVGEIIESGLSQRTVLELPVIGQFEPDVIADWPVVVLPLDRLRSRLSLGMARDAGVAGRHRIHQTGI